MKWLDEIISKVFEGMGEAAGWLIIYYVLHTWVGLNITIAFAP